MHKFQFPIQIPLPSHKKCDCWEVSIFFLGNRKEIAWPPGWLALPDLSLTSLQLHTHSLDKKKPPFKTGHLNTVLGEDDGKKKHYLFSFNILIIWQNTQWGETKFWKCLGLSFFSIFNTLSLVLPWVCHPTIPEVRTNPRKLKGSLAAVYLITFRKCR